MNWIHEEDATSTWKAVENPIKNNPQVRKRTFGQMRPRENLDQSAHSESCRRISNSQKCNVTSCGQRGL